MKSESSWTKKRLAVELSILKNFEKVDVKLEQYATPSEIAADWLWNAALKQDIAGKIILDAACGPGIIGCGALLLDAKKIYFVDMSQEALDLTKINVNMLKQEYEIGKSEFLCENITRFDQKVDIVLQNPPFGTQIKHHDKIFLEKAFSVSNKVYSMHKLNTSKFIETIARDYKFKITDLWNYDFGIKHILPWHRQKIRKVRVGLWRMEKPL